MMASKWQRSGGQQQTDLTGFGRVVSIEDDGGAVVESIHPRQDQVIVPAKTAAMFHRSRLNGGVRLAVGDLICYVANRSFVVQYLAATVGGWGTVATLQRGHGFLSDENHPTHQVFFPGSAVTDDLWNFHNLTQSLRIGDQLQYQGWDQTEYLDRSSTSFKAETITLPTMKGVTGDADRPDLGFVMQQSTRRFECVLYCNPYGPVMLHRDDVDEKLSSWPPEQGTRFIFETVADDDDQVCWRALRARPRDMLLKRSTTVDAGFQRQTTDHKSSLDGDDMMDELNELSSMSSLSVTTSGSNGRLVFEATKKPSALPTKWTAPALQPPRSQPTARASLPGASRAKLPEKATQTESDSIQLRFINTIVNDPEILNIITTRYTQVFHELIQAQN